MTSLWRRNPRIMSWRVALGRRREKLKIDSHDGKGRSKSDEGELYVRLGNVYLDGDQFAKAADSVQKGLKKGGVKRPDQARLVLGMSYFNLGEYDKATRVPRCRKDERSEKYSKQWIKYIKTSEEERQRELEKEIF
jgi:tetratricopeptide (TPR) repeat protein